MQCNNTTQYSFGVTNMEVIGKKTAIIFYLN